MKTIDSTLSQLTDISIVENLRKVLREKDREFLPVEAKFQEAMRDLATRIGNQATKELVVAWDRQICSDLVYAGYLGFQANLHNFHILSVESNLKYTPQLDTRIPHQTEGYFLF